MVIVLLPPDPGCANQVGNLSDGITIHEVGCGSDKRDAVQVHQCNPALLPVVLEQTIQLLKCLRAEHRKVDIGVEEIPGDLLRER